MGSAGTEQRRDDECSDGENILHANPPMILRSDWGWVVPFGMHRLIVADSGMECE
jgi:hypothetical protein